VNDLPLGVAEAGGGGPSTVFERPLWQRAPGVSGKARISPDVSFLGDPVPGYAIYRTAVKGGCTPPGWSPFGGRAPRRRCSPARWRSSASAQSAPAGRFPAS
jgi:hypothetical protein